MTDKTPAPAPSSLVAVINPEARIHDLPFYTDQPADEIKDAAGNKVVIPRRWERLQVLPGLNFVEPAKAAAAGVKDHAALQAGADPTAMSLGPAIKLAADTASAPALRRWLATEPRPQVREAIEKRLASRRAREVAA